MIDIRKKLINFLLREDEEIIKTEDRIKLEWMAKPQKKIEKLPKQKKIEKLPKQKEDDKTHFTRREMRYINVIYKPEKDYITYSIRKNIKIGKKSVQVHFGSSHIKEHIFAVRDYLEFRDFDPSLQAKEFGLTRMYDEQYYFNIKAIMDLDKRYQNYLKGGNKQ